MLADFLVVLLFLAPEVMSAAHKETGKTFEAPGARIYYEIVGAGPGAPLIVVNGGPGFDHTYLHLSPAWDILAKNRRVIFYDQRGTGRSGPLQPGESCTFADQVSDLEALRAHLGLERLDILGHSWGGFLGMAYAARFPQRVSHLILLDSVPTRWSDIQPIYEQVYPALSARRAELAKAADNGDTAASWEALRAYLAMLFYSPRKRQAFLDSFSPSTVSFAVSREVLHDAKSADLTSLAREFPFPTLVANGRFDTDITPAVAFKLAQAIPHATVHIFEQSGHMPFYEEPEEFVRVLEGFLTRNPR